MPSQDLTVRVRVQGMGQYASEMRKGATATKQVAAAGENLQQVGGKISNIGDRLTTSVTLPIVAVGAAATKLATDFDNSFTTMQTLAGLSAEEVDGLKESVLGLAGETGKAPQELAEALYFLRSSGLEGAAAMEALEVSAKASAAGLGDTQTIADAVSSAMLGYAESGLEAAEATDVLIATAKAGKAEPAELAGQMGRLIPIASELGISFADVGGAIAALSTKGNDAAAATTQLSGVMAKLMSPSQQAAELLEGVGLSVDRVRELIAEKGLLGTLEVLKERLGDSGFVKFFEDIQAKEGALALLGGDLEKTRGIFEQVNDSVGETDKAFATWADSMGAQNAKAFADLQVALIRVGDVIAPIAADILSFVAGVVSAFSDLPDPVQKFVIALAGIAAAVGPLMSVGGRLISVWGSVVKVFDNLTSTGGRAFADAMNAGTEATNNLSTGVGGVGKVAKFAAGAAGVGALLLTVKELGEAAHDARVADLVQDFMETADAAKSVTPAIEGNKFAYGEMADVFDTLLEQNPELAQQYLDQAEALGLSKDMVESAQAAIDRKTDAEVNATAAAQEHQEEVEGSVEALADEEQAVNEAAEAYKNYADTIRATFDPVFGLLDALRQNQDAQRGVVEAQAALDEAIKNHGRNSAEAAEASIALQDAILGVGDSALEVTTAAANLNAAVAENPGLVDEALSALQTWRDQGIIPTDAQLQFLQDQIRRTALQGAALGEVDPQVDVTETGSRRTRDQLTQVENRARAIPPRRNTNVTTKGADTAIGKIGAFLAELAKVPSSRTVHVNAVVTTPGALDALSGRRAHGGPVSAGRLYEVGEQGRAELLRMGGRSYLIPGSDGFVDPAGGWHMASGRGGGGAMVINISMAGAIIASQDDAKRWIAKGWNEAAAQGLINVRGKRVA